MQPQANPDSAPIDPVAADGLYNSLLDLQTAVCGETHYALETADLADPTLETLIRCGDIDDLDKDEVDLSRVVYVTKIEPIDDPRIHRHDLEFVSWIAPDGTVQHKRVAGEDGPDASFALEDLQRAVAGGTLRYRAPKAANDNAPSGAKLSHIQERQLLTAFQNERLLPADRGEIVFAESFHRPGATGPCWHISGATISGEMGDAFIGAIDGLPKFRLANGTVYDVTAANDNEPEPVDLWRRHKHPPLPRGLLPAVIEDFAVGQGELMGVDAGGLAAAALAVCAAAIPDSIKIRVKQHDTQWLESARIWVAVVGNPSTKKSPLIAAASAPLKRLDGELFRRYAAAISEHDKLPAAEKKSASSPKHQRLRLEDTTIEAAQEVLRDSPNGVLCLQDELAGWFGSMEKYSSGRGASKDRAFWLQSFNGGNYTVNRVGRGASLIENLSVSLLGGIQPEPIRAVAADSADDGLLQRLFPIVLGAAGAGVDMPAPDTTIAYDALVGRLSRLRRPGGDGASHFSLLADTPLHFDDAAQALRTDLAERHFAMMAAWEAVNKKLAAHIGKYDGLFARLCIIFHCVDAEDDRPATVVAEDTARRAANFLHDYLFPHAVAFYSDVLGMGDRQDRLLAIAGYILAHKLRAVSVRDIRRGDRTMRDMNNDDVRAVMEQLDALGWVDPLDTTRHDSAKWIVRPAVHTRFADRADVERRRREGVRAIIADSLHEFEAA